MDEWVDEDVMDSQTSTQPVNEWVDEDQDSGWVDETSGISGAFGSSVDRLQAGYYELMGDDKKAQENLLEAQSYTPSVRSYKDISSASDLGEYLSEQLAASVPYAPALMSGPLGVAAGVGLAGLEAGATYAEQEEKDVLGAAASAGANILLERIGLGGSGGMVTKAVKGLVEEGGRGAAQHLIAQGIGYGKSFDDAMKDIDEAIVGGASMRAAFSTASKVIDKSISPFTAEMTSPTKAKSEIQQSTMAMNSVAKSNLDPQAKSKAVREAWIKAEDANTAEAARKMNKYGANLKPKSFDFDVLGQNVMKKLGVDNRYGGVAESLQARYDVPFIGSMLPADPKVMAKNTANAFRLVNEDFNNNIKNLNLLDKSKVEVERYIKGDIPKMSSDTLNDLYTKGGADILHEAVQTKRARQMNDNTQVKEASDVGTLGTLGEAVVTGGVPVFSSTAAGVSAVSRLLSSAQNKRLEKIIAGKKSESPEAMRQAIIDLVDAVGKMGIQSGEDEWEDLKLE